MGEGGRYPGRDGLKWVGLPGDVIDEGGHGSGAKKVEAFGGEESVEDVFLGKKRDWSGRRLGYGLDDGGEGVAIGFFRPACEILGNGGGFVEGIFQPGGEIRQVMIPDEVALMFFGEVAEVEVSFFDESIPPSVGFGRASVGLIGTGDGFEVGVSHFLEIEKVERDGNSRIGVAEVEALFLEVTGDFRKVAAEERLPKEVGLEEGESKAFGNGGGSDVAGAPEPLIEGFRRVDDVEIDGEVEFSGKTLPFVMNWEPFRVFGGAGDGESGAGRGVGCPEAKFPEIFPSDATDGVENERVAGICVPCGGGGECVGEGVATVGRNARIN